MPSQTVNRVIAATTRANAATAVAACAQAYQVRPEDLYRRTRQRAIVEPRQVAMYLLRHHWKVSLPDIACLFSMNHATVIHACVTVKNLIDTDDTYRARLLSIRQELGTTVTLQMEAISDMLLAMPKGTRDQIETYITGLYNVYALNKKS